MDRVQNRKYNVEAIKFIQKMNKAYLEMYPEHKKFSYHS